MRILSQSLHVTTEWIIAYAQSIESPLQYINQQLIAPVTMPILFWKSFEPIYWLNTDRPLLHGSQHFAYTTPITAGMILDCELALIDQQPKIGKTYPFTLFKHRLSGSQEDKVIFTAETTLIQVGDNDAKKDYR
jgi:hypothetical protein